MEFEDADLFHPDHPFRAEICEHGWHRTKCRECAGHAGDRASGNMEGSAEYAGTEDDHEDIDVEVDNLDWVDSIINNWNMEGRAENAGTEGDYDDIDLELGDLAWMDRN